MRRQRGGPVKTIPKRNIEYKIAVFLLCFRRCYHKYIKGIQKKQGQKRSAQEPCGKEDRMKFDRLIRTRYSVRRFDARRVDGKKLETILNAAYVAPSARNNQSWRVLVINEQKALEKLRQCTPCHYNAPLAFLIGYEKDRCYVRKEDGATSGEIDASIAGTHMMLEACELGIGSTWVMNYDPAKVRELFHIPENIEIVSILVCGYPRSDSEINKRHTEYAPIDTLVTFNDYEGSDRAEKNEDGKVGKSNE